MTTAMTNRRVGVPPHGRRARLCRVRLVTATSVIRVTSFVSSCGEWPRSCSCCSSTRQVDQRGSHADIGRVAASVPDAIRGIRCSRSPKSAGCSCPRWSWSARLAAEMASHRSRRVGGDGRRGRVRASRPLPRSPRTARGCGEHDDVGDIDRFPSLAYVAGAAGATMVGKPWLSRSWRRASDVAIALPRRRHGDRCHRWGRPAPPGRLGRVRRWCGGPCAARGAESPPRAAVIADGLRDAGIAVSRLTLRRAEGGRAQLYEVEEADGRRLFVKVYDRDSRDADLLYRGYRTALYRGPNEQWASGSLDRDVEHEALMLLVARRAGVRCPALEVMTALPTARLPSPSRK